MTLNQRQGIRYEKTAIESISNVCLYCGFYCRTAYWSSTRIPPPRFVCLGTPSPRVRCRQAFFTYYYSIYVPCILGSPSVERPTIISSEAGPPRPPSPSAAPCER